MVNESDNAFYTHTAHIILSVSCQSNHVLCAARYELSLFDFIFILGRYKKGCSLYRPIFADKALGICRFRNDNRRIDRIDSLIFKALSYL